MSEFYYMIIKGCVLKTQSEEDLDGSKCKHKNQNNLLFNVRPLYILDLIRKTCKVRLLSFVWLTGICPRL